MILYHGSNVVIHKVDFGRCRPFKDFGKGFYLTDIEEQAARMARRTATVYGGTPVVNVFDFDETAAFSDSDLKIKRFAEPNEEWALFVLANRNHDRQHPVHDYDLVIGPVADDTIATLFRNFNDGIIDLPMLVNGLKYKKVSSQFFFATAKALKYLKNNE